MEPLLLVRSLKKRYGQVIALAGVDLDLMPGEVLGLLGDNGAGKTTFIRLISGVETPDGGSMHLQNRSIDWKRYTVSSARKLGVETVHQDRALGEKQPIWRNFFMGRHYSNALGFIDASRERREVAEVLKKTLGLSGAGLHPDAPVSVLSGGERQGLAIGRAMFFDADLVILDEPTTALAHGEVEKVLRFVEEIRQKGKAAIMVSHNLAHVHRCCDRFVFFDRGRTVGNYRKEDLSLPELIGLFTGFASEGGLG